MINMHFAPCILICLAFVQSNGLQSASDLEKGRYILVEIDDEEVNTIATDQTESSSYLGARLAAGGLPKVP